MQGEWRTEEHGRFFPVKIFLWGAKHTYVGEEIGHLWFSSLFGEEAFGNIVVIWRGPMEVKLEYVRDQTERVTWDSGARITGPDLVHLVAEFPQVGSDLVAMYSFQGMLADELGLRIAGHGGVEVRGTDVYVEGRKLNVGVCAAHTTSCTMHFGVNASLRGSPSIPAGVRACSLSDLGVGDPFEFMRGVAVSWLDRVDSIYRKSYKTR